MPELQYTDEWGDAKIQRTGERLIEMYLFNNLQISNTFYDHPIQHKIRCLDETRRTSMIDCFIKKRQIHSRYIIDIHTLSSAILDLIMDKCYKMKEPKSYTKTD